ncbi:hypothetical protein SEA_SUCCESS_70 [Streptomyces phage Success]|uniref:Uncharacterized protein n=1 Tax=Streptomyces phage Success TaxID=2999013 RepID=A0A9E8M5X3_9CAUD|nr:hypothetical protein QEH47_gp62 [Streptomyces phage Success]WAB08849.1 hypothetical protein SEA_SUCCESS_70 [Streptomyces phage Success]
MAKRYRVVLSAYATTVVYVEADNYTEANRAAKEEIKAGRAKPLPIKADQWTPTSTSDMSGPRA